METLSAALSWGTPVGISLFFFFSLSGLGIFFWGLGQMAKAKPKAD